MFVLDPRRGGYRTGTKMPIEESNRPLAGARLRAATQRLLDASPLCSIATVTPEGDAYVNTAYFAWGSDLNVVWLSDPGAKHSRNILTSGTAAVAVYDSSQTWGQPDRGIQLFGTAREVEEAESGDAAELYVSRFADFARNDLGSYRFYVFRPHRVKLFDERELGAGRFVTAVVDSSGLIAWETTEIYHSHS
jgi:uncharacterized protein YhbP (UPF0306 family)